MVFTIYCTRHLRLDAPELFEACDESEVILNILQDLHHPHRLGTGLVSGHKKKRTVLSPKMLYMKMPRIHIYFLWFPWFLLQVFKLENWQFLWGRLDGIWICWIHTRVLSLHLYPWAWRVPGTTAAFFPSRVGASPCAGRECSRGDAEWWTNAMKCYDDDYCYCYYQLLSWLLLLYI